jgi:cysteine desulfurase
MIPTLLRSFVSWFETQNEYAGAQQFLQDQFFAPPQKPPFHHPKLGLPCGLPSMIYLDHHASTPCDPRVWRAIEPYFLTAFGNAGSVNHAFGAEARDAVERARGQVAAAIGATPREIIFTSGATESNNLALKGIAHRALESSGDVPPRIVSVTTEHPAVLDPLAALEKQGCDVVRLPVTPQGDLRAGEVMVEELEAALTPATVLVSVMWANNEIGVIQPLPEIAALCRDRGIPLHTDAVQAVGKVPVDLGEVSVDLLSLSAHKIYGPKGVGALYVRRQRPALKLIPQIDGGGQERGLRSGTLNVPGIVGLGAAAELAVAELSDEMSRIGDLRDRLYSGLRAAFDEVDLIGPALDASGLRLPGNLNLRFPGIDGEALMLAAAEVAVSSGAACASTKDGPSHVLTALGLSPENARCCLRFGVGRSNTPEEIDRAVHLLAAAGRQLTNLGG